MPQVRFDQYYRYEDLTRLIHAYAEEFPHLVGIESIGKSYEERDIWLMTVSNFTISKGVFCMTSTINKEKYIKLLAETLPRVIDTEEEYERLLSEVSKLMALGDNLTAEQAEVLQLLAILIEGYEDYFCNPKRLRVISKRCIFFNFLTD